MLRGITRDPLNLREASMTLLHMPPQEASFTLGQKCPDVWHAICSLELEYEV